MPAYAMTGGFDMTQWGVADIIDIVSSVFSSSHSATHVTYANAFGESLTINGNFTGFDANGDPTGGVVTSFTYTIGGPATIAGSDLSISVPTLLGWVSTNNVAALQTALFGGADTFIGSSGGDTIAGLGGDDTLDGGGGSDWLYGGDGNNTINGGDGDDTIFSNVGDVIDGGAGNDRLFYDFRGTAGPINANVMQMLSARNVESIAIFGSAGADTFTLDGLPVRAFAADGAGGVDQFVMDLSASTQSVFFNSGFTGLEVRAGVGFPIVATLSDMEIIELTCGQGDDSGRFVAIGADQVDGGAGIDTLELDLSFYGGGGAIVSTPALLSAEGLVLSTGATFRNFERLAGLTMTAGDDFVSVTADMMASVSGTGQQYRGGDGFDTLAIDFSAFGSGVMLSAGALQGVAPGNLILISGFEVLSITGGAFRDSIASGEGNDTLIGNGGHDHLVGNAGRDWLDGGDGDDTLEGSVGDDTLHGGAGVDSLDGGEGADALIGGTGNDTYFVDTEIDVITELAGEGADSVNASATYFLFDEVENLTLIGAAVINGSGNALANVIVGNGAANQLFGLAGNDTLDGGAGADSLFGGLGDDLYIVDNAADFAFEGNVAWGIDLVQASVSYALGQNIDNLTLVGAALVGNGNLLANVITGNANPNTLFGMAGNDTLNGGAGADQMFGGLGDDLYIVDEAADFTFEAQTAWGTDTVQTSVDYQLGQNIDNLVLQAGAGALTGRGNLLANTITGNESANTLFGFAGNDTLDGGLGADQLYGREGDDTYIVDNTGDVVAEANAAWGIDTIQASVTYFLAPNLENLTLTGAAAINGNGNGFANIMLGNSAANNLFGFAGADTLDGGAGADSLFGGEGDDLYIVDHAGDVGFEANAAWGVDLVQASVSHTLGTNLDNLALTGASAINGTGNGLANVINGNSAANAIFGLGGADTLNGGAGNDSLDGGAGDDAFMFAPGSGSDTVSGFIAGGVEDIINLSAYSGSGVTWTITQSGADTVFAFSNGDQITLTGVTAANLVQTDPFGYA